MANLQNILFLDIETVSQYHEYESVPPEWQKLWDKKTESLRKNNENSSAELYPRAAIYAEFGKIICISCGIISGSGENKKLIVKSFYGNDEVVLLQEFADMLHSWGNGRDKFLCAHNGKEFDFPYLCRRMIINNIKLPEILMIGGKKPWEITHIDTMELWKFGDYKSYTSLSLLALALGIPTPKDDIDGSMVGDVYWKEKNLERVVTYCQKDVITLARVYLRFNNESFLSDDNIEIKK